MNQEEANNKKDVFILGAGFSAPIGLPLISNFLDISKSVYLDYPHLLEGFTDFFKKTFDYRTSLNKVNAKSPMDLDNIEELFSYLDLDAEFGLKRQRVTQKSLIYTIVKTLDIRLRYQRDLNLKNKMSLARKEIADYKYLNCYEFFANVVSKQIEHSRSASVITLNYDTLLDEIFNNCSIKFDYCLPKSVQTIFGNSTDNLKYLKLHGSSNWSIAEGSTSTNDLKIYDPRIEKYLNIMLEERKKADGFIPLIVPPAFDKSKFQHILNPVWNNAVEEIRTARRLFIIGYSFPITDMYFSKLLTLALADNEILEKIYVVDVQSESTQNLELKYTKELFSNNYYLRRCDLSNYFTNGTEYFINDGFNSLFDVRKIYNSPTKPIEIEGIDFSKSHIASDGKWKVCFNLNSKTDFEWQRAYTTSPNHGLICPGSFENHNLFITGNQNDILSQMPHMYAQTRVANTTRGLNNITSWDESCYPYNLSYPDEFLIPKETFLLKLESEIRKYKLEKRYL